MLVKAVGLFFSMFFLLFIVIPAVALVAWLMGGFDILLVVIGGMLAVCVPGVILNERWKKRRKLRRQ